MGDELTFTYPPDAVSARALFRASLPGLNARLASGETLQVRDISAGGICVIQPGQPPVADPLIRLDLYVGSRLFLEDLHGHLVRVADDGVAAYTFVGLTRQQEYRLDKLILSIQKHMIAQRRAKEQHS